MKEIFKDIKEYEGSYQISNFGNVKSLNYNRSGKERLLKPKLRNNYLAVDLSKNGKNKTYTVHQLVSMAFLDHIPSGMKIVVDHIDNNQLNNRLDNLQLISNRENSTKDRTDVGVSWNKPNKKWMSRIVIKDKEVYLGSFKDKQDALNQYQKALTNLDKYENPEQFMELLKPNYRKDVGVSWSKPNNKWKSQITIKGKNIYLGCFKDKQDALNQYQNGLANIDKYDNPKQFREYLKKI